MILRKLENLIDFQFTQLFFQNKKDLTMKLWGIISNMVTEVSELFNLGINQKIWRFHRISESHFSHQTNTFSYDENVKIHLLFNGSNSNY